MQHIFRNIFSLLSVRLTPTKQQSSPVIWVVVFSYHVLRIILWTFHFSHKNFHPLTNIPHHGIKIKIIIFNIIKYRWSINIRPRPRDLLSTSWQYLRVNFMAIALYRFATIKAISTFINLPTVKDRLTVSNICAETSKRFLSVESLMNLFVKRWTCAKTPLCPAASEHYEIFVLLPNSQPSALVVFACWGDW